MLEAIAGAQASACVGRTLVFVRGRLLAGGPEVLAHMVQRVPPAVEASLLRTPPTPLARQDAPKHCACGLESLEGNVEPGEGLMLTTMVVLLSSPPAPLAATEKPSPKSASASACLPDGCSGRVRRGRGRG